MTSGVLFPEIRFASWRNSETVDPIGTRHLVSGAFAFDKVVDSTCDGALVFNGLRLSLGANDPFVSSNVAAINFCVPNFGDLTSSGLNAIYNMRLWIPSGSGSVLDLDGIHMQFQTSGVWTPNFVFPSGAGQQFLTSLPSQFNVRRIDGRNELISFNDQNVSEWIYLRIFLDATFPVGTYGICGSGLLRPRLTYDFY